MASPAHSPSSTTAGPEARELAVLSVHNFYQQPGGEDQVFASEAELLEQHGHTVERYSQHNSAIGEAGVRVAIDTVWNRRTFKSLSEFLAGRPVDVVHFHNTFPLISPAAYYAAQRAGVPVVQTLHNFRLICPGATLYRDGSVCEECVHDNSLLPAIRHACYRGSRPATAAVAAMLATHRTLRTYRRMVDVYIALSDFSRRRLVSGGLPAERVVVKPNFVSPDPGCPDASRPPGDFALFAGRLDPGKGILELVEAWKRLPDLALRVAGDGPLASVHWPHGVESLGRLPHGQVIALMKEAQVLVFPSTWYECCPLTILEAQACGLPVIAPLLGSIPEFVRHHHNGLLYRPGDAAHLAEQVRWAFEHPAELAVMRRNARKEYETHYTPDRNYKLLLGIYQQAIERARQRRQKDPPA